LTESERLSPDGPLGYRGDTLKAASGLVSPCIHQTVKLADGAGT